MALSITVLQMQQENSAFLCAAGGQKSYLATQHLTQICMNECEK